MGQTKIIMRNQTKINLLVGYILTLLCGNYFFELAKKIFITQATAIQMAPDGYIAYNWTLRCIENIHLVYIIGMGALFGWIYYKKKKENSNEEE